MAVAWGEYKESGFQKPPGEKANDLLAPGSDEPRCWWAESDIIDASDFNLTASRYKPQVGEEVPNEDPADLIGDVSKIEQKIMAGLEKLRKDVEAAG